MVHRRRLGHRPDGQFGVTGLAEMRGPLAAAPIIVFIVKIGRLGHRGLSMRGGDVGMVFGSTDALVAAAGFVDLSPDTAVVVQNPSVKSGRSLKLTSGSEQGRICLTPTRAAMEATEAYRQAHNLGRGGGVTNGWLFWQPRTDSTV